MEGFYKHICHPLDVCGHLTITHMWAPYLQLQQPSLFWVGFPQHLGVCLLEFLSIQEKECCVVNTDIGWEDLALHQWSDSSQKHLIGLISRFCTALSSFSMPTWPNHVIMSFWSWLCAQGTVILELLLQNWKHTIANNVCCSINNTLHWKELNHLKGYFHTLGNI